MWIVALALRRPYTFVVMALVIILLTPLVILRTPVDIFPDINIPVVSVVWNYTGLRSRRHGRPHRHQLRARHHHHGQRHRTHRIAVGERHRRHQDLLPARRPTFRPLWRRSRRSCRPRSAACRREPRRRWSLLIPRLRLRSCSLASAARRCLSSNSSIWGKNFLRTQLATVQGAATALSLRRQDTPDAGRSRHAATAGQRPLAQRHRQRRQRAEPDYCPPAPPRSVRWNTRSR